MSYKIKWKKFWYSLFVLTLITSFSAPAFSQDLTRWEGVYRKGTSLGLRGSFFSPKDSDDDSWMGGAQLRFHLNPALALEGSIDYRKDEFGDGALEVKTYPVQASILAYLGPSSMMSPYLIGGVGWYFTRVRIDATGDKDTEDRFGFHAGAGFQAWLNIYWSVDASYRFIWVEEIDSKDVSLTDKAFDDNGHQVTIGLNYHF